MLGAGLSGSGTMKGGQSIAILAGAILMLNPDIDLIGLAATCVLAVVFIPYAVQLWRKE